MAYRFFPPISPQSRLRFNPAYPPSTPFNPFKVWYFSLEAVEKEFLAVCAFPSSLCPLRPLRPICAHVPPPSSSTAASTPMARPTIAPLYPYTHPHTTPLGGYNHARFQVVALNLAGAVYESRELLPTADLTILSKGMAARRLRIYTKGAVLGTDCVIPDERHALRGKRGVHSHEPLAPLPYPPYPHCPLHSSGTHI